MLLYKGPAACSKGTVRAAAVGSLSTWPVSSSSSYHQQYLLLLVFCQWITSLHMKVNNNNDNSNNNVTVISKALITASRFNFLELCMCRWHIEMSRKQENDTRPVCGPSCPQDGQIVQALARGSPGYIFRFCNRPGGIWGRAEISS